MRCDLLETPLIIHPGVRVIEEHLAGYAGQYKRLYLIVSVSKEQDGKRWLHASCSRTDKSLPSYEDLKTLKAICIGDHHTALQVFLPKDKHVNWAGERGVEVLHLWRCLDGDVTPDFTRGTGGI